MACGDRLGCVAGKFADVPRRPQVTLRSFSTPAKGCCLTRISAPESCTSDLYPTRARTTQEVLGPKKDDVVGCSQEGNNPGLEDEWEKGGDLSAATNPKFSSGGTCSKGIVRSPKNSRAVGAAGLED